jgi:methylated-DNA-[protein]-cysteine S-methyltransferase
MSAGREFAVFETPIGPCAIVWGLRGIVGCSLPEPDTARTRARVRQRYPEAVEAFPPPEIRKVIDAVCALLRGEPRDLSDVAIDLDVPEFDRRVYEIARTIRPGETLTYGEIAARLGDPLAARDVGQALGRNPCPILVPCHRVRAAGGKLGGFSARGGAATKLRLLEIEGALKSSALMLFDELPAAIRPRRSANR